MRPQLPSVVCPTCGGQGHVSEEVAEPGIKQALAVIEGAGIAIVVKPWTLLGMMADVEELEAKLREARSEGDGAT